MTDYTRLTIVGTARKAEMVVPADEPIGGLIPRLMELLDERPGAVSRPLTLVRSTGEQLDTSLSVAEQRIVDGELLRLLREDAAPPPPEVADVTDVLAESLASRPGLWTRRSRTATAAVAIGLLSLALSTVLARASDVDPVGTLAIVYGLAVVVALVSGRFGGRWLAVAATSVALGCAAPLAVVLGAVPALELPPVDVALAVIVLAWVALALGAGAGLGSRSAWWGGVLGVVLGAVPIVLRSLGVADAGAVGVGAVLAVVVCGLLPWFAMSASGLTGLDDQVVDGRRGRRDEVLLTVGDAYRTLTWSTFAVAGPVAVTAVASVGSADLWQVGLGVAVVLVVAARTRALPIAAQGWVLWAAALLGLLGGLLVQPLAPAWLVVVLFAAGVVVAVVAGGVDPVAHQRASLRRVGNLVESLGVVALLPVLLGVFGVYADLLGAFS
ncbi:EsaB/YukD family protein [Frigoribacterium sp. PhB24]|uniref:EsaB/YukD family protein n=1 Tax=Frigoribacterium sp. PhB24 TaxID=2485204 RepID=UPI000F475104|nr:EsaB/YukD family protein [Frigoribacterium sp. PhB24]ROS49607.1 type VII secretion integral membrane protein EccD [Frigoribacterium sp. PhB24]